VIACLTIFCFLKFKKNLVTGMISTTVAPKTLDEITLETQQKRMHLWFPNIFEFKGGIQVYSNFLLEALEILDFNVEYEVFLKHDRGLSLDSDSLMDMDAQFHFAGAWPLSLRTPAFVAQVIGNAFKQRPDLILSTHLNFTIAAYWLKHWLGIPYWTIAHGIEAWDIQRPALKKALHYADRILAVSNYTRDRLIQEQHLDPDKISILPNTFDPDRFAIAPKPHYLLKRHNLTPDQPIILTVSRLSRSEPYKGYNRILESLPQIRERIPNIHYIIVGKGDDRSRLEQYIHQNQLQDCVSLTRYIPDSELCDYYNLCDVFAMPSKGEGFGIVYLEALACGKPVLAGNQDGAMDALCQGELGALVDPDDIDAIAQTLIAILQKQYPHPLMYQPDALRQKVIDTFGFEHFQTTLSSYLERYFVSNPSL
jgi:glycosyltransferase involved in cell wall biosynthesis